MKEHLLDYIDQAKSSSVRGLRIMVEYFYALEIFHPIVESKIKIVSVFGSARRKEGTPEYEDAKKLGKLLYQNGYAVVTGASMGIMQAANEGVAYGIIDELRKKSKGQTKKTDDQIINSPAFKKLIKRFSVGLKISLPFEPVNNPFVGIYATFHYFMVRKFFFGSLSSAFIACEGGWGTRDELFEILTLVQTGKAPLMPIIYVSPDPKHLTDDLKYCVDKGYISKPDLDLIDVVSDYRKAVTIINKFYSVVDSINYDRPDTIDLTLAKALTASQKKTIEAFVKKNSDTFGGVEFHKRKFALTGYRHKSYGLVMHLIMMLAKDVK